MDFPERREVEVMMDLKENLVQEVYLIFKYFYKEVVKNAFSTTLKMNYTF
jgi:hypothetical protein